MHEMPTELAPRPPTPPTQFQHRDDLIGFRSTYIPKPEGKAGPQSYHVRDSFHFADPPSIDTRRSLHGLYGREFCRSQRKRKQLRAAAPPLCPPSPVAVAVVVPPVPAAAVHGRKHIRSHSLTTLPVDQLSALVPPSSPMGGGGGRHVHARSRSFSISEMTVSQLLGPPPSPPPPPADTRTSRAKLKWKQLSEHLWHEKSKLLLNALVLTPPRHLYIERKNEVQNPLLVHDAPPLASSCRSIDSDTGRNFDSFIAGYFRNLSTTTPASGRRRSRLRRESHLTSQQPPAAETTETKWARWRQYPREKRRPWPQPTDATENETQTSGGVRYGEFLAQGNSYRQRAALKMRVAMRQR
ncbi:Aste57867_11920 [Aphanomyces stellatus]|uniref:Aste57867_11920 protein n=1 Tax=Aphanomyces stellatus TaxID=120398 RepID=A0A485KW78_9STRA|nr:hypothetical protein As57867_011875 [Aphanomyces stellatus]VFT88775.1 Aste57867_11920 [Aphanomyces stellatus]